MYSVRQLQALNCRFKHGSADDNATGTIISRQLQKYNSCTHSTNRNCKNWEENLAQVGVLLEVDRKPLKRFAEKRRGLETAVEID